MRTWMAIGACLLAVACGHAPANRIASPTKVRLGPVSCAEVPYASLSGSAKTQLATKDMSLGLHLGRGSGEAHVTDLRLEILPVGSETVQQKGTADPLLATNEQALESLEKIDLPSADQDVALIFKGTDSAGRSLPPGLYPLVFSMKSEPVAGSICTDPGASVDGVLTMLKWNG